MGIFDLFRSKKEQKRTPAEVIGHALKAKGIAASLPEIEEVMGSVSKQIQYKTCLPEEMMLSFSAELERIASGYMVYVSMGLLDGTGRIPQSTLNTIFSLAIYYASASELANKKGVSTFVIKSGQRLALCDFSGLNMRNQVSGHPIYELFPDLLNKSLKS